MNKDEVHSAAAEGGSTTASKVTSATDVGTIVSDGDGVTSSTSEARFATDAMTIVSGGDDGTSCYNDEKRSAQNVVLMAVWASILAFLMFTSVSTIAGGSGAKDGPKY